MLDTAHPVCPFCEEPVLPEDAPEMVNGDQPVHRECMIRAVSGSVAHIQKRCMHFIPGSTETDPEGMTKREAAKAARAALQVSRYGAILNERGTCPLCGCVEFHPGPCGGMARNIKCAGCKVKYWYSPPFPPTLIFSDDQFFDHAVRERLPRLQP
jgi:hypothetical protein